MKIIHLFLLLFLTSQAAISQIQKDSFVAHTRDEKELVRLTNLMSAVSGSGDSSAYKKYIDKNYLGTYSRCSQNSYGKFAGKDNVIKQWTRVDTSAHAYSRPMVYKVQVSGKTAIVHSYILDGWTDKEGKKITTASWATDVWVKRKKQWYWISSHESILF